MCIVKNTKCRSTNFMLLFRINVIYGNICVWKYSLTFLIQQKTKGKAHVSLVRCFEGGISTNTIFKLNNLRTRTSVKWRITTMGIALKGVRYHCPIFDGTFNKRISKCVEFTSSKLDDSTFKCRGKIIGVFFIAILIDILNVQVISLILQRWK